MTNPQRACIFGAQYGSEGKGCFAEWLIEHHLSTNLVVFGENAPNSGHTNLKGKTRSLPVSAYYAKYVILGPDSAIEPHLLSREITQVREKNPDLQVLVHSHAAMITQTDILREQDLRLDGSIGSTVTGGGAARTSKALLRNNNLTMRNADGLFSNYRVIDRDEYFNILSNLHTFDWLFECSQGLWLDVNLGIYPYVTSRNTHPRVAIERNGLGFQDWRYYAVHRTFPIRTGGNSGPTGAHEIDWIDLGVAPEIATVTKRTRRVFAFSRGDFLRGLQITRPDAVVFTHLDYMKEEYRDNKGFLEWLGTPSIYNGGQINDYYLSDGPGLFRHVKIANQ